MARASLINPRPVEDGVAFTVEAWPFRCEPFEGPARRDWDGFSASGDSATFEWRSRADRVWAAICALLAGTARIEQVLEDEVVEAYLANLRDIELPDAELERAAPELLDGISWEMLVEYDGPFAPYACDDDFFAHEAARALELPEWAKRESSAAGGPGTGYDEALIVLHGGHTLEELEAWLDAKVGGETDGDGHG